VGEGGATLSSMTAKEQLLAEAPTWTEEQAQRALLAARDDGSEHGQPPFSLIGAVHSGRGDLSERASRDEFEPESSR
jgi:hypothetical protein